MLVKKELQEVPIIPYKKINNAKVNYEYAEFAQEIDLKNSGHIVATDFYDEKSKELKMRSFYDGKNVISYLVAEKEWSGTIPSGNLGYFTYYDCRALHDKETDKILKKLRGNPWGENTMIGFLSEIVSDKYRKLRADKARKEKALFEKLTAMLPLYPKMLGEYCEKNFYKSTYIIIGKLDHGKRKATCAHCGYEFEISGVKPHMHGKCPNCKEPAEYFPDWVARGPKEKKKEICICCRNHGNLIMRWVDVERYISQNRIKYSFDDNFRSYYISENGKQTNYVYCYVVSMGYCEWSRLRNGEKKYGESYLYMANLRQVFGRDMYGIDLFAELSGNREEKLNMADLLDSLKTVPQTKYILHMGLKKLASKMIEIPSQGGKTFQQVLGVRAQYLEMYKEYDVSLYEHLAIKATAEWINEEVFSKIREMKISEDFIFSLKKLGAEQGISVIKGINYLYKQIRSRNDHAWELLTEWKDYLEMSALLKIDLGNKQLKFPKDLRTEHNRLTARYRAIEDKIEAEKAKKAFKVIYTGIPEYWDQKYRIVFPRSEADFIREGQELHHCVGCGTYYRRHIEGINMIFFIRKNENPEKPYFTVEINVGKKEIVQLYGDHDCTAPKEIRNFVLQFIKNFGRADYEKLIRRKSA